MGLTKQQLEQLSDTSFPNNNSGYITPAILRNFNDELITNTVNQDVYSSDSSSFDSRIDSLEAFSSSLNNNFVSDADFNSYTQSNDTKWNNLASQSGSWVTSNITASSLVTASFDNNSRNLTFTKGDSSTFSINIPDVSGSSGNFVTTSSFNSYTSSTNSRLNSIESKTGSYAITGSNTFFGNQDVVGAIQASDANVGPSYLAPTVFQGVGTTAVAYDQFVNAGNFDALHIETQLNNGTLFQDLDPSNFTFNTWLQVPANNTANPSPQFKRGLGITGSLSVSGGTSFSELTGSLGAFSSSLNSRINAATNEPQFVTTSSFNSFTSSVNGRLDSIESKTGSYATTGSNSFLGNQIITGSLIQSSSATILAGPNGAAVGTWIKNRVLISDISGAAPPRLYISGSDGAYSEYGRGFQSLDTTRVSNISAGINTYANPANNAYNIVGVFTPDTYTDDIEMGIFVDINGISFSDFDNGVTFGYQPWLTIEPNLGSNPTLQFKRSADITGSLTIKSGSGDLYVHGHKQFNAGEFWSTTTQSGSAGVSGSITFNTSGSVYGVSIVSASQVTMANAGVYNIQFSAQIETSAGADTAYIWFKKNGSNIADSATKVVLANNTAQVMTVNILDTAAANDYYQLAYQFTNGNATILAEAASGNIPAIPSVILTVTQAR